LWSLFAGSGERQLVRHVSRVEYEALPRLKSWARSQTQRSADHLFFWKAAKYSWQPLCGKRNGEMRAKEWEGGETRPCPSRWSNCLGSSGELLSVPEKEDARQRRRPSPGDIVHARPTARQEGVGLVQRSRSVAKTRIRPVGNRGPGRGGNNER